VRQIIGEQADATLEEVCQRVRRAHGTPVSLSAMSRLLKKLGLARQKSRSTPRSATHRASKRPARSIAR
jgi:transposase